MSDIDAFRDLPSKPSRPASLPRDGKTESQKLISLIRDLCHEATQRGDASELILKSLELCTEYEAAIKRGLVAERAVHGLIKRLEAFGEK